MPNYDFTKDAFHLCWSNGDELAHLDRESLSALSTVLSAALNADEVEMPVALIENMLEQIHAMDTKFAKVELAKHQSRHTMTDERIANIVDRLELQFIVRYTAEKKIELLNWNESQVLETFDTWQEAETFAQTL